MTEQKTQRQIEIKWLKDRGIDQTTCGLCKLSDQQIGNLVIAINSTVNRQCRKAVDQATRR